MVKTAYVYDWIEPAMQKLAAYLEDGYTVLTSRLWEEDAGDYYDMRFCAVLVKGG